MLGKQALVSKSISKSILVVLWVLRGFDVGRELNVAKYCGENYAI